MSKKTRRRNEVIIGGLFVIVAALITAWATIISNQSDDSDNKSGLSEGSTATANAVVSSGVAPSLDKSSSQIDLPTQSPTQEVTQAEMQWVSELEPLTEEGLWKNEQAKVHGHVSLHPLVVPTEWGDDSNTSWRDYALSKEYTQLSGLVGIKDGGHRTEEANFQVLVDGDPLFQKQIKIGDKPAEFNVDVTGTDKFRLQVTDIDNSAYSSDAVFADVALH